MSFMVRIIVSVLSSLYQIAGFAIVTAVLFMFLYLSMKEFGWKTTINRWWVSFKQDVLFRRVFYLAFYTTMILFRTLFNRNLWFRPLENIIGVWGIYDVNGQLTTEVIENLILFIPFTVLYLWVFRGVLVDKKAGVGGTLWKAVKVTFLMSFVIEFLQLFLRIGTFQLSDLFYNTLGGVIGGIIYCGISWLRPKKDM